jgi:hypothetical protein
MFAPSTTERKATMAKRPPRHKVSQRQRAKAISTLASIVADESIAPYVRAKSANALIGAAKIDDDALPEVDPDAPRKLIVLPDNGRDPGVRFGIYEENQGVAIVPAECYDDPVMPEAHYAGYPKPAGIPIRLRAALARGDRQ